MEPSTNVMLLSRWRAFSFPLGAANMALAGLCLLTRAPMFVQCQMGAVAGLVFWRVVTWPLVSAAFLLTCALWNYRSHSVQSSIGLFVALLVWYSSGFFYISLLA